MYLHQDWHYLLTPLLLLKMGHWVGSRRRQTEELVALEQPVLEHSTLEHSILEQSLFVQTQLSIEPGASPTKQPQKKSLPKEVPLFQPLTASKT